MNDVFNELLKRALALHKQSKFGEAEVLYNRLLNRAPFNEDLNFLLADLYLRKEFNGLAINLLSGLVRANPDHSAAWCNLGAGFRKEGMVDEAKRAWGRALELSGDSPEVCGNMAGLYADGAEPLKALEWIDRALAVDPDNVEAHWLKALSLLSLKRWDEGWQQYEWREKLPNWSPRNKVNAPKWDGRYVDRLYIHGEQGVGDEVMFASCLPFVKAGHITVEVNERVAALIAQSFPGVDVVCEEARGDYDAKIPIGSLIGMFGMNPVPYLRANPDRVDFYRQELRRIGPAPYVALAWFGGTKATRCEERSISLAEFRPLRDAFTCVSGQYSDSNPYVEAERAEHGLEKITDASTGLDLHEQAALFSAVDAVVTVQQTAVHVAGGVGAKTLALIGSKPHWRYGLVGDSLPFYKDVSLYRRTTEWPINRVLEDLRAYLGSVPKAKRAVA